MATQDTYRDANRRSHKLLGNYLALWAWTHDVDCVVLGRSTLLGFLDLQRMQNKRIDWLTTDIKPLFTHSQTLVEAKTKNYMTLYLSRVPLPPASFIGTMSDDARVKQLSVSGVAAAKVTIPTESEIVSILANAIHGIADFPFK